MIDFKLIENTSDDFWSDYESQRISGEIALFTDVEWHMLASELASQGSVVQERVTQILGDFNLESAADILLLLAAAEDREIALTAREALRGMSLQVVTSSAKRLVSEGHLFIARLIEYKSINEVLYAIESKHPSLGET